MSIPLQAARPCQSGRPSATTSSSSLKPRCVVAVIVIARFPFIGRRRVNGVCGSRLHFWTRRRNPTRPTQKRKRPPPPRTWPQPTNRRQPTPAPHRPDQPHPDQPDRQQQTDQPPGITRERPPPPSTPTTRTTPSSQYRERSATTTTGTPSHSQRRTPNRQTFAGFVPKPAFPQIVRFSGFAVPVRGTGQGTSRKRAAYCPAVAFPATSMGHSPSEIRAHDRPRTDRLLPGRSGVQGLLAGCVSNPSEHQSFVVKDCSDCVGVAWLEVVS